MAVPSSVGGIILFLLIAGALTVTLVVPLTTSPEVVPFAEESFGASPNEDYHYQNPVCPCKDDWSFGTNERILSNTYSAQSGSQADARGMSTYAWAWGQFIDHDIVRTDSDPNGVVYSIPMTPYDQILLNMTRVLKTNLENSCAKAQNHITPFIDATTVYSDYLNPERLDQLRLTDSCEMQTSSGNNLPLNSNTPNEFLAGDVRATEHAILTSLHTLFVREHNRLCGVLNADTLTKGWTNNQKFWKVRQIVIAKIQHITYNEWLPALFGTQSHLLSRSHPLNSELLRKRTDGSIVAEFAGAAYRFGHSMVNDPIGPFSLPGIFFNRQFFIDTGMDAIVQAAVSSKAERADTLVVDGLRNFLFSAGPNLIGEDLVTRNLFRGRDLQLGPYAEIATCYGQAPVSNVPQDPLLGLLSESVIPGSALPQTIAYIVAEQFQRTRRFDSNFYDMNWHRIGQHFRAEITGTTLGKLFSLNTNLKTLKDKNVFFV